MYIYIVVKVVILYFIYIYYIHIILLHNHYSIMALFGTYFGYFVTKLTINEYFKHFVFTRIFYYENAMHTSKHDISIFYGLFIL